MTEDARKKCAYPGCAETFVPRSNSQRYHDLGERRRLFDQSEKGRAQRQRYEAGTGKVRKRTYRLSVSRSENLTRLAALQREEQEWVRTLLGSQTRTK